MTRRFRRFVLPGSIVATLAVGSATSLDGQSRPQEAASAAVLFIRGAPRLALSNVAPESVLVDAETLVDSSRTPEADLASLSTLLRAKVAVAPAAHRGRSASLWIARFERAQCALEAASYYVEVERVAITGTTGRVSVHVYRMSRPEEWISQPVMFAFYDVEVAVESAGWRGVRLLSVTEP